jgi:shikimate kinase
MRKEKIKNNIIISGLKSSGKSTLGRWLARKFSFDFVDSDREIENLYYHREKKNLTFREIYKKLGEKKFRKLECETISNLQSRKNCVISLGGGALANPAVKKKIKKIGYVILLDAPKNILFARIKKERELPAFLNPKNPFVSFEDMYNKRRPVYLANCDMVIDLSKNSAREAKKNIIRKVKNLGIV